MAVVARAGALAAERPVGRPRDRVRTRAAGAERRRHRSGWLFVLPATALFAVFFVYPLLASFWQSLYATDGGVTAFVGLAQYRRMLVDPLVAQSLLNAGLLLLVQVPLMVSLALGLAYLLNLSWLRLRTGFRLMAFLPAVTSLVAYSVVFRVLLATDGGAVNQLLGVVGLGPVDWLNDPLWARVALVAAITWRWTGYNMVILLAGLQAVPKELYEAARLDGASGWQVFSRVVVPQLRPVLVFVTVTSTIGALQLFDEVVILTGGGPSNATLTPVLYLYRVGFEQFDFGYASAIAWVVVLLTMVLSVLQLRLAREK
ncbi:sugar ABC transporter permease [Georgenia daeguensis]|uniref:Sugar ABC transporter permease n=1 Tax=Georgenia daeguensis TaxID=908355 RepID=A0ABP8EXY8_9MICO